MHVVARNPVLRLRDTAVHDQHLITAVNQTLDDVAADELGATNDCYAHADDRPSDRHGCKIGQQDFTVVVLGDVVCGRQPSL